MRVTNEQILAAVHEQNARWQALANEIAELREELRAMNGRVREHDRVLAVVQAQRDPPCGEHASRLARLEERVGAQGVNWGRVWAVVQMVLNAVILAVLAKIGLGG